MEKRYDSDGSERQWQRLHRKKKTKISIELYEIVIIYSDIFLPLPPYG